MNSMATETVTEVCYECELRPAGHGHFALYCAECAELPYGVAASPVLADRLRIPEVAVDVDGHQFIVQASERACGCHPAMPVERTADGWACKGCGVHA